MAYIDTDDMDALVGEDVRQALFTDESDSGAYNSTKFARAAAMATDIVRAACLNAGYADPGTTTSIELLKAATLGAMIDWAFRRRQEVPGEYAYLIALPEAIRTGEVPVPGLTPDAQNAPGGVRFTDSSTTSSTGKPSRFKDLRDYYGA